MRPTNSSSSRPGSRYSRADEGIDAATLTGAGSAAGSVRGATPTLTRRIKQAVAEWYVLNLLEQSWGGLSTHTTQGFNIGKPPYGYRAEKVTHPVKARADEGKTKTRLIPDPIRAAVVAQIFRWRAGDHAGYDEIARPLNTDLSRYPPPEPIGGKGRRRVGAWTGGNVREVLDNPKHTGYMVWNRRKRGHPDRDIKGHVNPPQEWVWSPKPTHPALVSRDLFEAATAIRRFHTDTDSGTTTAPTYLLRSHVFCDLCGRRCYGTRAKGLIYYRCSPDSKRHSDLPWYATHPRAVMIREDTLIAELGHVWHHITGNQIRNRSPELPATNRSPTPPTAVQALPRERLHSLCEALQIQLRYNPNTSHLTIRAVIAADTPAEHTITNQTTLGHDWNLIRFA